MDKYIEPEELLQDPHLEDDYADAPDDPFASPPTLTLATLRTTGPWQPGPETLSAWRVHETVKDGKVRPAPVSTRIALMLDAHYWPLRNGSTVYACPRTTRTIPIGGILQSPREEMFLRWCSGQFSRLGGGYETATGNALNDGIRRWGDAATVIPTPWLRWGRGLDGALWWDAAREDTQCVRVDGHGWTVENGPACWFRRPSSLAEMMLPIPGGDAGDQWRFLNVEEIDRQLVLAWQLSTMIPEMTFSAGMLYLAGVYGTAKSTSADFITAAAGSPGERHRQKRREDDRDFLVTANATWTLFLDNLSSFSAEQSDLLAVLITGLQESNRTLFTDTDTTVLKIRRPVLATSINLPVLRGDLIDRMVPVRTKEIAPGDRLDETDLTAEFNAAQPAIFGGLLDLMVKVMAHPNPPPGTELPRLGLGRIGWKLDQLLGTGDPSTAARLDARQWELMADTVGDSDPFFAQLEISIAGHLRMYKEESWVGTAGELAQLADPMGEHAKKFKDWPPPKAVSGRLERNLVALRGSGWTIDRVPSKYPHHPAQWSIVDPTTKAKASTENT